MRKLLSCLIILLLFCFLGCGKSSKPHRSPYSYVLPKVGEEIKYKLTYYTSGALPRFPPTATVPNPNTPTQKIILRCIKVSGNSFECGVIYPDIGKMAYKVIVNYNATMLEDRFKAVDMNGKVLSLDEYVDGLPIPFFCFPAFTKTEIDCVRSVSQPLPPDLTVEYQRQNPPEKEYPQSRLVMTIYRKNDPVKGVSMSWHWADWMWFEQEVGYLPETGPRLRYKVVRE